VRLDWHLTNNGISCGGSRIFFHYTSSPPDNAACASFLSAVSTAWTANIKPLQSTSCTLAQLNARDLGDPSGGFAQSTPGTVGSRGAAGAILIETCAVINHLVQLSYRGGKPRTYLTCGVSTDLTNNNQWTPTARTAFQSGWIAFIQAILAASGSITIDHHVAVQYYKGATGHLSGDGTRGWTTPNRLVPPQWHNISTSTCRLIVGTQRRRLTAGS
jgi:hypothetical protein